MVLVEEQENFIEYDVQTLDGVVQYIVIYCLSKEDKTQKLEFHAVTENK